MSKLEEQFFMAAKETDIDQLEKCIDQGVDINIEDQNGLTALDHLKKPIRPN